MFTLVQDRSPAGWQTYWVGGSQLWLVNISLKQCRFSDLWGVPMMVLMAFTVDPQLTSWWPGSVIAAAGLGLSAFAPNVIFLYFSAGVLIGPLLLMKLICSFYSTLSFLGSDNCISSVCSSQTNHLTSSHCWLYRRWKDQPSVNTVSWWFFL